jgi:hypothetical protein
LQGHLDPGDDVWGWALNMRIAVKPKYAYQRSGILELL